MSCIHLSAASPNDDPEREALQRNVTRKHEQLPQVVCPICNPPGNRQERRALAVLKRKLQRAGSPLAALLTAQK
jgi:hypothetical protein